MKTTLTLSLAFLLLFAVGTVKSQDTLVGNVTYANYAAPPMSGILIQLYNDQNVVVDQCYTDVYGDYEMIIDTNLPIGYYHVQPTISLPWQGVNGADIHRIIMHAVFGNVLQGIEIEAADVTDDQQIKVQDAVLVIKRVHNIVNSFPAGDWQFEADQPVLLNNFSSKSFTGDTETSDMRAKQSGDTDPAIDQGDTRKPHTISIVSNENIFASNKQDIIVPVKVTHNINNIGALCLKLNYLPEMVDEIEIIKAIPNITSSINKEDGSITLTYSALEEKIGVDINELSFTFNEADLLDKLSNDYLVSLDAEDVFCYIRVRLTEGFTESDLFEFKMDESGSEVRFDEKAKRIEKVEFEIPGIENIDQLVTINQNYPNPCANETSINYFIGENGIVSFQVFDAAGVLVGEKETFNQNAGNYTFNLNTSDYQAGIYYYSFVFEGKSTTFTRSFKFVVMQ